MSTSSHSESMEPDDTTADLRSQEILAIREDTVPAVKCLVSLDDYCVDTAQPHWMQAALRTAVPIDQHLRHGRSTNDSHHAEYLAVTGRYPMSHAEWDGIAATIKGAL